MIPKLSEGTLDRIIAGEQVDKPIMQLLGYKKVQGSNDKYRFLISDGVSCHSYALLGTQLNSRLQDKEFERFTVVRLDKYVVNQIKPDRRIVLLLELTVVARGSEVGQKIGTPAQAVSNAADNNMNEMSHQQPSNTGPSNNINNERSPGVKRPYGNAQSGISNANSEERFSNRPYGSAQSGLSNAHNEDRFTNRPYGGAQQGGRPNLFGAAAGQDNSGSAVTIHPINSLTPYQNRWTIRARVFHKSTIRTWSNSRGEGKLFSIDLIDESGEIRATAFNEQCDKFYDAIEVNKVYYISKCTLKTANKKFTSIKNEYEMSLNSETTVIPCNDNVSAIPTLQFDFVPILELQNVEKDCLIDVIGVCKSSSDLQNLISRTTNKELRKRDVHLVDNTGVEVTLTLWDVDAEKFDGSANPIVAVKGARVSDFGGKSLSVSSASTIQINPDIREAHKLRGWYDREGATIQTQSLSNRAFAGGVAGGNATWKTFAQAKAEMLGSGEKPDYFTSKACVSVIRRENCLYMACPSQECNKKVVDMNNGRYRCEKCNQEYDSFKWRYLLMACLSDFSENQWVTCFQETAETLLGISSEELGRLKEMEEDKFNEILAAANFKSYIFRLRTKMEMYNEESRFKTTVVSATPVDPLEYGQKLVDDILQMEQHL